MKKKLVVFDGNSKFFLGGGQVVTLNILELFRDEFKTFLIEVDRTDEFFRLSEKFTSNRIRVEGFFSIIKIFKYFKEQDINAQNSILYSATKISHLYFILFSMLGFKTIVHIHSVNSKKSILYYLLKFAYLFPGQIIYTSNYVQSFLHLKKGNLVYNSVKKIENLDDANKGKNKIVYVGSVVDFKGVEDFCKVSVFFEDKFNFEIWGTGELVEKLKGRYPKVKFAGFVPNVISKLNQEAYLLVLPTRIPEAFGLVIAEAFAAGVPVITTNIGAQYELVKLVQSAGFFSVGSVEELKEQIDFYSFPENYNNVKLKLECWENYFSEEVFKDKLFKVFNMHFDTQKNSC